jgi:hypothetical protein
MICMGRGGGEPAAQIDELVGRRFREVGDQAQIVRGTLLRDQIALRGPNRSC